MMKIGIIKRGKSFESQMDMIEKKLLTGSRSATVKVGIELLKLALEQTPKDTGDLRNSSLVKLNGKIVAQGSDKDVIANYTIDNSRGQFDVEVSFNTKYALRQHEDLTYNHKFGKAKYLEDPLKENITRFMDFIITEIRKELK